MYYFDTVNAPEIFTEFLISDKGAVLAAAFNILKSLVSREWCTLCIQYSTRSSHYQHSSNIVTPTIRYSIYWTSGRIEYQCNTKNIGIDNFLFLPSVENRRCEDNNNAMQGSNCTISISITKWNQKGSAPTVRSDHLFWDYTEHLNQVSLFS